MWFPVPPVRGLWAVALLAFGCAPAKVAGDSGVGPSPEIVEAGEWLPGGLGTNTLLLGSNALSMPAANLDSASESLFYSGNSFFNAAWVEAPASTDARDGLGPLFNARSCSGCHTRDGRAGPPDDELDTALGVLVRLSDNGGPHAIYGGQIQDLALPDLAPEARVAVRWVEVPGVYGDGTAYSLRQPLLLLADWADGPLEAEVATSLRVSPHMSGLGLLEAIPADILLELEDPEDDDGDGISGRVHWREDGQTGVAMPGRFGWKAEQPTVRAQSAGAFAGDLGVTSSAAPHDDCTGAQPDCTGAPSGGSPELDDGLLDRVAVYASVLAVPVRRDWDAPDVLRGKGIFADLGCGQCHVPQHLTGDAELAALERQLIWPYTDLLLHDMGPDLADAGTYGEATGAEWRTPPLWGLGLVPVVNGHNTLLHDGRARGFAEAVLWHGGEGQAARDGFAALDVVDRDALVRFLESL